MTLCTLFNQFFDTIFQEAKFTDTDKEKMKTSLNLVWLKRVGQKITPILGQEQLAALNHLYGHLDSPAQPSDPALAEQISLFLQDTTKNQQVVNIFFDEAEKLITHVAQIFSQHASPDQIAKLRSRLSQFDT
jgi:hypothetical protein